MPTTKNASYDDDHEEGDNGTCGTEPRTGDRKMTKMWSVPSKGLICLVGRQIHNQGQLSEDKFLNNSLDTNYILNLC